MLGVLLLAAICQHGILAGAALQWSWRRLQRPPRFIVPSLAIRIAVAACVAPRHSELVPVGRRGDPPAPLLEVVGTTR